MQRACALLYQSVWRGLGRSPIGWLCGRLIRRILSDSRPIGKRHTPPDLRHQAHGPRDSASNSLPIDSITRCGNNRYRGHPKDHHG